MAVATKDTLATGLDNDFSEGINWGGRPGGYDADMYASKQREAAAIARQAPQIDYSQANTSLAQAAALAQQDAALRGQQTQGLNMLQAQAAGQTPSAAAINAGLGAQMGLSGALQGMASGHTSLAQAAAARQSLMAGGQAQLANLGQASAARSQELANANQNFAAAAGQARASDYGLANGMTSIGNMQGGMATAQGQQNLQQQQLNQQYAEQQEQQRYAMGQAMSQGEQDTLNRYYAQKSDYYKDRAAQQAKADVIAGTVTSSASMGLAGASTAMGGGASGGDSSGSDGRTKETAWDVVPLYEQEGQQLHQSLDGHAFYLSDPQQQTIGGGQPLPSLASAASLRQESPEVAQKQAKAELPPHQRRMTDAELLAAADREIAAVNADKERRLAQGPAVGIAPDQGVLADANRTMAGQPYRYKPEFTPPDEVPGQIHHGFMAQNLEQNPVTAAAVFEDPTNGMKRVHHARMIQAMASGLSDLQRQVDETRATLASARRSQ